MKDDDAARLLARAAIFRRPCDLDLVVFVARHPRSLLASEWLAAFLGYELKQIAHSLKLLLGGRLIKLMQTSAHAARLYLFVPGEANHDWFQPLVEMASTRQALAALRLALSLHSPEKARGPEPAATNAETRTRSILIQRDQLTRGPYRRGGG